VLLHHNINIQRFLAQNKSSLEIECIPTPAYKRQGDEYIMDVVCSPKTAIELDRSKLKYYTDAEIRQLYYCKSYLNVQRISDLCTADGVFILPSISKGERSIRQCASKLGGIRQERPGGSTLTIWTRFLNTICKNDNESKKGNNNNDNDKNREKEEENGKFSIGTIITKYWNGVPYTGTVIDHTEKYYKIRYNDNDKEELNHTEVQKYKKKNRGEGRMTGEIGQRMRLRRPLGEWTILANESERMWPFYYSHDTDTLYRSYREEWHSNGEFYNDCHTMTDNDTYEYVTTRNVNTLPPNRCNGYRGWVESITTSTDEGKRNREINNKKLHEISRVTRRTYSTVLHSDRILCSTIQNIQNAKINTKSTHSNRWRSNTVQRIDRIRICR
jgi:hypothetical protein